MPPRRKAAPATATASPSPSPEGAAPVAAAPADKPRMETYEAVRPDGSLLVVTRNIETGEATYAPK